ncbi:hypothetical protein ACF3MZ_31445 [Paenibacillaceae bacterium WGS1546]|uniref:hypothetical protein n=1 Tax=Cohnella sp. WGS1546 TaxID=3366810 RepID=UPI00372D6EB0
MEEKSSSQQEGRAILFRIFAFVFAIGGLIVLEGLTEGLEPWVRSALAFDPHPEELRFHGAVHGALIGLLFGGSLFILLWRPLTKPMLVRFYFVGHLIFLGTLVATGPAFALTRFSIFVIFGIIMTILYFAYGKSRREIIRPTEPVRLDRPLLVLSIVALLGLLPFLINGAIQQFQETEEQFRWGEGTALALTMIYGSFMVSTAREGSGALGVLLGLTFIYMGAAALALPEHEASWGVWGGSAAILFGGVYAAFSLRLVRSVKSAAASGAREQTLS